MSDEKNNPEEHEPVDHGSHKPAEQPGADAGNTGKDDAAANSETDPVEEAEKILADAQAQGAVDAESVAAEGEAAEGEAAEGEPSQREAELLDDLRRLQAEFVNYRNRVQRDKDVAKNSAIAAVCSSLIPVFDDIAAAREHGDLQDGPFAAIARKLETTLAGHGMEVLGEKGAAFDPNIHEALVQAPHPEIPADHVAEVLRLGYRQGDRVLRAAQVVVSTGPAE